MNQYFNLQEIAQQDAEYNAQRREEKQLIRDKNRAMITDAFSVVSPIASGSGGAVAQLFAKGVFR